MVFECIECYGKGTIPVNDHTIPSICPKCEARGFVILETTNNKIGLESFLSCLDLMNKKGVGG